MRGLVSGSQRALKGWVDLATESKRVLAGKVMPLMVALKHIAGKQYVMHDPYSLISYA